MLNEELLKETIDFNEFTLELRDLCRIYGKVLVQMRNGDWINVIFREKLEEPMGFRTEKFTHIWMLNGKSITSRDLDLINF